MSRRNKLFLGAVSLVLILTIGTVSLGAATAIGRGVVQIEVDSGDGGGDHFGLAVPAVLIDLVLLFAPVGLVANELPIDEIRPYLPAMRELSRQIEQLPDAVFVEVTGPDETVRIAKSRGRFVVDVRGRSERVHVSVPVSSVARLMRTVDRLA
jgi:hypothetical protein